jgi:hypothetical protein
MTLAYRAGRSQVLHLLGLHKIAASDLSAIEELAKPSFLNKIESLLTPALKTPKPSALAPPDKTIAKEREYLQRRYNVTSHLTGSMPLQLNIPGDVDIDFFVRTESPKKFKNLIRKLEQNNRYTPSPYNKPNAGYYVFQRPAQNKDDYPVDLAIAYGEPGKQYKDTLRTQKRRATQLPEDLRQQLVTKKHLLRHTPLDFGARRYKAWKRQLSAALGGDFRLDRAEVDALKKIGTIIDLSNEQQLDKFQRFTNYKDMYGHRTHNLNSVLERQGLISALEALKRGKLKSYEAGSSIGTHEKVEYNNLSPAQLKKIEDSMLEEEPDTSVFEDIAEETGRSKDAIKADFLRQDFNKIKRFLRAQDDPEEFRKDNFSVSKLGPNIFVTKGGILDAPSYGDSAVLLRSRTAKKSPFLNLVTDEYIVPSKAVFEPRKLNIGSGYVLTSKKKINTLNKNHPNVKFVATESLPKSLKEKLLKPKRSLKEVWQRWIPSALSGDLSIGQTK